MTPPKSVLGSFSMKQSTPVRNNKQLEVSHQRSDSTKNKTSVSGIVPQSNNTSGAFNSSSPALPKRSATNAINQLKSTTILKFKAMVEKSKQLCG